MSEAELVILQNIQYAIDNYDKFEFGEFEYDDIKGLLDLYIKEKIAKEECEELLINSISKDIIKEIIYSPKENLEIIIEIKKILEDK